MSRDARMTASLAAWAAGFMLVARLQVGLTIQTAFLALFVGPVVAAFLPSRAWRGATFVGLATTLPLIGISTAWNWLQLTLLTISAGAAVASLISPPPGEARRERGASDGIVSTTRHGPPPPGLPGRGRDESNRAILQTVVLLAYLAWLTWPVWLAHAWSHPAAAPWLDRLLAFNPIAAAGGVLIDLGDWTHQPFAYKYLVNLGQDVPYEPPPSAWPAIALHGSVAVVLQIGRRFLVHLPVGESRATRHLS